MSGYSKNGAATHPKRDKKLANPQNFGLATLEPGWGNKLADNSAEALPELINLPTADCIMGLTAQTFFHWDLQTDEISWADGASVMLQIPDTVSINSGAGLAMLIDPDHVRTRFAAILSSGAIDEGEGVSYQVTYRLMNQGRSGASSLWIEEVGRWFAGKNGLPAQVYGTLRIANDSVQEHQRLLFLSGHDALTGLFNRSRLTEILEETLAETDVTPHINTFFLISIDNLSVINEAFGFDIGDEAISAVGRRIRTEIRESDSIGRFSSNKFGAVITNCSAKNAEKIATRLHEAVKTNMIPTSIGEIPASISIGSVLLPVHARTLQTGIANALQALDIAKSRRHEYYVQYEPSLERDSTRQKNVEIADNVISALNERRLKLALQPIVDLQTGSTFMYETLLRMEEPDGNIRSAGEFISIAEQSGLIRLIDRHVLELTVSLLKSDPSLNLSMNISSLTAMDADWLDYLIALTRTNEGIASRLVVEITETAAIKEMDTSMEFVDQLKSAGCRVAIDDFGAGYTSFRNLKMLDVDIVKIDGSFVSNMRNNKDDHVFVKTLIDLARNFRLKTVAEWVDDEATTDLLRDMGIDYVQGFYHGRPQIIYDPAKALSA